MAVTPNTVLKLLKCPLELDNLNQLTFNNVNDQFNYFNSLPYDDIYNITYQRKDNVIRYPKHIDTLLEYNYVMYQNSNYSDKWFYAYIDKMEYLNDSTTLITISTDCYQTWMFDLTFKRSFVVREHTNNDTIGYNTVPEGIETGEYVLTSSHPFSYLRDNVNVGDDTPNEQVLVIGVTRDPTVNDFDKIYGDSLRGTYSGVKYYAVENAASMNNLLKTYANKGFIDDVVSIFIAPIDLVIIGRSWVTYNFGSGAYSLIASNPLAESAFRGISMTFEFPSTLDGYTPRNKKLFTKEFSYIYATNFCGSGVQYYYEYFQNVLGLDHNYCQFHLQGVLTPGCSIESLPDNYQNTHGQEYNAATFALPAPKLPLCNWNSDQFTNWLAQNGTNRMLQYAGSAASAIGSAITGNPVGIAAGIGGILGTIAQYKTHSFAPNSNNGSLNNSDSNFAHSRCFGYYSMSVSNSMARKIDRVFDAIGYATNEMKIPNLTGRRNWNYVKTQAVAIQATIPQEDLQTIKDMFDNGVTLWHNAATFLDYSQNNDII